MISKMYKPWTPNNICNSCRVMLNHFDKKDCIKKAVIEPVIWRVPLDHVNDCFFCACDITGFNTKNKRRIVYTNVSSVTGAKIGKRENENVIQNSDIDAIDIINENEADVDIDNSESSDEDNLVRDLDLAKDGSELLASRLKERNMLAPGTKICSYRNREEIFIKYFSQCENLVYCNNVRELINEYECEIYDPNNFRLFIDSCKQSLKSSFIA